MNPKLRTFYTLVLTQAFSQIGSKISSLAVAIWIFEQTSSATPLALTGFFMILPILLASTISGVLADRWDRRLVLVLADVGQAAGTVLLFVLLLAGDLQLWHLYLVAFVQSLFGTFQGPAFQASITLLVPDHQRDRANALQQISGPAAGIIAPVLAGWVYALVGLHGAILIDLFTFIAAIVVVCLSDIPRPETSAEGRAASGSVWKEALGGARYLWQKRPLFYLQVHMALVNFFLGGAGALIAAYVLARTGSEAALGMLLGCMNLGAVVGGLVMGLWGGTRSRIRTLMLAIMMLGGFMGFTGLAHAPWLIAMTLFGLYFPLPIASATHAAIMQAKVPPDMQGRVFAAGSQVSLLLLPQAYLGVGPLADRVFEPAVGQPGWEIVAPLVGSTFGSGMGLLIILGGGFTVLVTLLVYTLPAVRHLDLRLPDYETTTAEPPPDPLPAALPADSAAS